MIDIGLEARPLDFRIFGKGVGKRERKGAESSDMRVVAATSVKAGKSSCTVWLSGMVIDSLIAPCMGFSDGNASVIDIVRCETGVRRFGSPAWSETAGSVEELLDLGAVERTQRKSLRITHFGSIRRLCAMQQCGLRD